MFTSIAGRSVVVTGASRGIGRGIAGVFAAAGARVLVVGRDEDALASTVAELTKAGGEASAMVCDVRDREQCDEMARTAVARHGGIDVLCANAGIFPSARLEDMKPEDLGQDYLDQMARSIPQRRLGTPADIGDAALFFASEEAGYVTGQCLVVDGGQVLPESLMALDEM